LKEKSISQLIIDPPVIAHRGASAYVPENTILAFSKAAQLGIKWIEFDVMLAADGQAIIFHDEFLDRTTNGHGKLIQYPYDYLFSLDAGRWFDPIFSGERIPSLKTSIEFLCENKMSANIEIKALPGQYESVVKSILNHIYDHTLLSEGRILFSSFSLEILQILRKYSPHCLIGLLLDEWVPYWQTLCASLNCVSIHVNHLLLTPALVHEIKKLNKMILSYTVNDVARAQELYSWGVDAIFSDIPDKIIASLQKK
jgi:glycerophosphoryl diester phosphodiesterase